MPISPGEFAAAMTPCLTLVGGVGMNREARKEWMHAAWLVLADMPADLLKRGIATAMGVADHPSKIVPAIMDEVKADHDRRSASLAKAHQQAVEIKKQIEETRAFRDRALALENHESTKDILARTWPTMHKHEPGYQSGEGKLNLDPNRETRKPTREDYIRMGVSPEALDAMNITQEGNQ